MAVTPIGKAETYVVPGTYQFTVGQRYYVNAATIYEGYQYVKWTATGGVVLDADVGVRGAGLPPQTVGV